MQLPSFMQSATFWEFAFVFALILLILSHKISIEGVVSAGA